LENYFTNTIINDFNKTAFKDTSLSKTIDKFIEYLDKKYPKSLYPERRSNQFLLVGYVNGKPQMIGIDTVGKKLVSMGTLSSDIKVAKYAEEIIARSGITTIYEVLKQAIYMYAKRENKEKEIGGPISIICVNKDNKTRFQENDFSNRNYNTLNDMYEAVKNDKIKMKYLVLNGKERLLKIMKR